jgi:oligoendopeptidase F
MDGKWDLTGIYASQEAFEADLKKLRGEIIPKLAQYEGKLSDEKSLAEYLTLEREMAGIASKLGVYASCKSDLNKKDVKNLEALSNVETAFNELNTKTAFEQPELLALGEEKIDAFLKKHPEFSDYSFSFERMFHNASHVLSSDKESLLSNYGPLSDEGGSLYSALTVGDFTPEQAALHDGRKVTVTQSNWTRLISETDPKDTEDRKAIFEALYHYYDGRKNAYGEIYSTTLKSELAEQRSRGYKSILESHLFRNAIPDSVYLNLVKEAGTHNDALKRYYRIKAKAFGLPKLRSYDRFLQLSKSDKKYTFKEAQSLFFDSISSFPSDFVEKAHEVSKDGYVDVYPGDGKRSGAYSTGGDGVHPYILLNFEGGLEDVFTLAHESGHSIHTLYAMENQPLLKQGYTIFVAEIASTFNEHNLLDYLLKSGKLSKADEIFLLQKEIDEICSTFYRQTLFAEYELEASRLAEKGEPINHEVLSSIMVRLYEKYYGIDIREEGLKPLVWCYIPHLFYTPFYVYQYATSFTASMLLYRNVRDKKPGAFERYVSLLKSGGSEYPLDQVREAGVDLTTMEPFEAVTARMEELVSRLEELLA